MVLKEKLGEASGKLVTIRGLPDGKFETTFRGNGTFLGQPIKDTGTIVVETLQNGASRLEGTVTLVAKGGVTTWTGFAIAKNEGLTFPAANFAPAGEFRFATGTFASLIDVVVCCEYHVDEDENYNWVCYEWACA